MQGTNIMLYIQLLYLNCNITTFKMVHQAQLGAGRDIAVSASNLTPVNRKLIMAALTALQIGGAPPSPGLRFALPWATL